MVALDAPAAVSLTIDQGAEYLREWEWQHDGATVPLDGYRATAQIRTSTGGSLLLDLDEFLSIADDKITLVLPATVTRAMTRSGQWDLFLIDSLDEDVAVKLMAGSVTLRKAVTVDD